MEIPKEKVLELIKAKLGGEKAAEADKELPDQVDPEQHAGLLSKFGLDPAELIGSIGGGGLGGLGGKLGL